MKAKNLLRVVSFSYPVAAAVLASFLLASPSFGAEYDGGVKARVITQSGVTGNGDAIRYPDFAQPEVTALEVDIAPRAATGWHKHPVPVYGYVVSGRLEVDMEGGKSLSFKPGDAIIEVVDTWHNGRNAGCEPVRLAVFYLGGKGVANVLKSPAELRQAEAPPSCPSVKE